VFRLQQAAHVDVHEVRLSVGIDDHVRHLADTRVVRPRADLETADVGNAVAESRGGLLGQGEVRHDGVPRWVRG
jgi:hypothetical protein